MFVGRDSSGDYSCVEFLQGFWKGLERIFSPSLWRIDAVHFEIGFMDILMPTYGLFDTYLLLRQIEEQASISLMS